MTPAELRDSVVRADGYSRGYFDGYAACAREVAELLKKEEEKKKEEKNGGA